MDEYCGEPLIPSQEQIFRELLSILEQLDQDGLILPALHVSEALEALSPGDPRIPLYQMPPGFDFPNN